MPLQTFLKNHPLHALRAALVLCVVGLVGCDKTPPSEVPVRAVRTQIIGQQGVGLVREYAGEVRARTQSRLGFRVGGKLVKREVELGQSVERGQVLAQIDPEDLRLGREAARAALTAAQANYKLAVADTKRFRDLRDQGFISAAELDRHETARIAAKAQLEQAKAEAGMQDNQTEYSTLKADAAGVITDVEAEPGQVVAAGTPVVVLARDGPRDAVFSVPEDAVDWLKSLKGKRGAVHVRRWGAQETIDATVREVAAAADPITRTFLVKADVGSADLKLGQTLTVLVETRSGSAMVHVPLSAVFEDQGQSAVWVLDDKCMCVQIAHVQLDGTGADTVNVTSGLRPGQEIVTAGVHVLTPGEKVQRYRGVGLMFNDTANTVSQR